jgi:hypothetical protein
MTKTQDLKRAQVVYKCCDQTSSHIDENCFYLEVAIFSFSDGHCQPKECQAQLYLNITLDRTYYT